MGRRFNQSRLRRAVAETLESRTLFSLIVPALNSLPGAPATLYLNFVGDNVPVWGNPNDANVDHPGITKPFDIDGNQTSFNATETSDINEIWSRVAEKYSPFNINVTTVDPINYMIGKVAKMDIGGDDMDWLGQAAGGISFVGGFEDSFDSAANFGFIFSSSLQNNIKAIGEAASHEAGHLFGLYHHSIFDGNGAVTTEYDPGNPQVAPVMGDSYDSVRGIWENGPSDQNNVKVNQDDMAVISGNTNHFGYRADDYGNTKALATALTVTNHTITAAGVISQTSDIDYFSFASPAGAISLSVSPNAFGPMLDATLELRNSSDAVIASSNTSSLGEAINFTLPSAGTYYVVVRSHGTYGDVGQYTVSGILPTSTFHGMPGGAYSVAEGSSVQLNGSTTGGSAVSYEWDFNYNGSTFNTTATGATPTFSAANIDGPASRTIALRVIDGIGTVSITTTTLSVTNVNPTAVFSSNSPVALVGTGTVTFSGQSDASAADIAAGFLYSYDFNNDGTFDQVGSSSASVTVPSQYLSTVGSRTIKGRIIDKDGGFTDYTTTIVVNANPIATFGNDGPVAENTTADVSFVNPAGGSAPYSYSYDFNNDGTFEITNSATSSATVPANLLQDGPGARTVRGRISDSLGAFTDYTTTITIGNTAPVVSMTGAPTTAPNEGTTITFSGSATDAPLDAVTGFAFSWTVTRNGAAYASFFGGSTFPLTLSDNGAYVVSLTATDKDGATSAAATSSFNVNNVAPMANFSGPPGAVPEGSTDAIVSFSNSYDPSGGDTSSGLTYAYDFDNDGVFDLTTTASSATIPANILANGPGSATIRGRIIDKDGAFSDYTTTLEIANVAPTLTVTPSSGHAVAGTSITFAFSSSDPGQDTISNWSIDFGDGTTLNLGTNPPPLSHTFASAGNFTITTIATDEDGTYTATPLTIGVTPTPAADLAAQVIAKIPAQIRPGYKGTATVRIANHGNLAMSGSMTVTLALSANNTLESKDIRLGSTGATATLAPGQSKDFKFTFTVPASTPNGKYFLLGSVASRVSELSNTNNTAAGPATTIQRPFVDLRPSKLSIKPGAHRGGKLTTNFQLTNAGTLTAKGSAKFTATLVRSRSTTTGIPLAPISQSLQLNPAAGKLESLSFTVPSSLAKGTYYVLVTVVPSPSLADANRADKQIFSATAITFV